MTERLSVGAVIIVMGMAVAVPILAAFTLAYILGSFIRLW